MQILDVVAICLKGATIAVAARALVDAVRPWYKVANKKIIVLKFLMAFSMIVKTFSYAAWDMPIYDSCPAASRLCTIFYHLSMVFAGWVLLSRATTVFVFAPAFGLTVEYVLTFVRVAIGIVDTILSYAVANPDGTCNYLEYKPAGMIYVIADLLIDIYVTIAISFYLVNHSAQLHRRLGGFHAVIISSNFLRTIILVVINMINVIVTTLPSYSSWKPIVWLVGNIIYVIMIVYDADMIKIIASKQRKIYDRELSSFGISEDGFPPPPVRDESQHAT